MAAEKQYKIVVSGMAKEGLGKIVSYIALDSVTGARDVQSAIISGIKSLGYFPLRTSFLEGEFIPYNKYHKLIILKRFLVIYQVKDNTVFVDYVVDAKQDYEWLIR